MKEHHPVLGLSTVGHHPVLGGSVAELKHEALDVLETNILPFWLNMQDKENGGFYGQMTGKGELKKQANKGGILNARILWSFSAAYRVMGKPEYLEAATRAKDYILEHFIDKEYGGTYWELDYLGNPVDTKKQFYAIGFMIYGLSEYARATGDKEALQKATVLFDSIEEHSFDPINNGYREACTRDWQPIEDMRLSDLDENYPKSQNTHLHIIEPYTNLYRALKERAGISENSDISENSEYSEPSGLSEFSEFSEFSEKVEKALRNLIRIFTEYILNPETNHLDLFFNDDWSRGRNHIESYGHDIECSWLLHEAALVLGDEEVLKKIEPIVINVARASEKGLNPDGSMIHEANLTTGKQDADLHWWVQAETVVGFLNIYQHFGDEAALEKAWKCWQFIKSNLIDYANGEWHWSLRADGTLNTTDDKAGFWKCPYHNSRMCLEIIERFA